MATLYLKTLRCIETEDIHGSDECELRIWTDDGYETRRRNMNNGETWPLEIKRKVANRAKIQLWDLDSPGPPFFDAHDHLGTAIIRANPVSGGQATFREDGADYVLDYDVLDE